MSEKPPAQDPIVLDREGRVIHSPGPSPDDAGRRGGYSVAWGTTASGMRTVGLVPKLLIGAGMLALLALGLAVAAIVMAAVLIGWFARFIARGGRR